MEKTLNFFSGLLVIPAGMTKQQAASLLEEAIQEGEPSWKAGNLVLAAKLEERRRSQEVIAAAEAERDRLIRLEEKLQAQKLSASKRAGEQGFLLAQKRAQEARAREEFFSARRRALKALAAYEAALAEVEDALSLPEDRREIHTVSRWEKVKALYAKTVEECGEFLTPLMFGGCLDVEAVS